MGYTQNCEIWHGASQGTLIMNQEEPIWRTMLGPCFGHKRAIFGPFLGKADYGKHPGLWNLAWSIPWHIDYDTRRTNLKDYVRTIFCHRKAIFWPFLGKGDYGIHPELWTLAWALWWWVRKILFKGPCEDNVWAIKASCENDVSAMEEQYFGHF